MTRIAPDTRARARALRREMTPQERQLWLHLRELNRMLGTNFRRQAAIGPYIADFVEFGRRLVIEADGSGHGGPSDAARDAWLARQGFRVLRFWNNDIGGNVEGVMQRVLDVLEAEQEPSPHEPARSPPPPPSGQCPNPTRGEGEPPSSRIAQGETPHLPETRP